MRKCNFQLVDCLMIPCADSLAEDVEMLLYIGRNFSKKFLNCNEQDFVIGK